MVSIIDFDFFADDSDPSSGGDRFFPTDVFLSHNRADSSAAFADSLRREGISVWHDSHEEIRSARVERQLDVAIKNSRYVLVFVEQGFRASPWCRAEYLPALDEAKRHDTDRVLVVCHESDSDWIPPELKEVERIEREYGVRTLCQRVEAANRFTVASAKETVDLSLRAPLSHEEMEQLADAQLRLLEPYESRIDVNNVGDPRTGALFVAVIASLAARRQSAAVDDAVERFTALYRECGLPSLHRWSDEIHDLAKQACRVLQGSLNHMDRRAAGFFLLVPLLMSMDEEPSLMVLLTNEEHPAALAAAASTAFQVYGSLSPAGQVLANRAGGLLGSYIPISTGLDHTVIGLLPEGLRLRLSIKRGIDDRHLDALERLSLIDRRVTWIVTERDLNLSEFRSDSLAGMVGVSAIEEPLISLKEIVRQNGDEILVLEATRSIVRTFCEHAAWMFAQLDVFVITDRLIPVLKALSEFSSSTEQELCDLLFRELALIPYLEEFVQRRQLVMSGRDSLADSVAYTELLRRVDYRYRSAAE